MALLSLLVHTLLLFSIMLWQIALVMIICWIVLQAAYELADLFWEVLTDLW